MLKDMIKARPTSREMYSALVSTLVSVQTLVRPFGACTRVWTDTRVDTRPRTSLLVGLVYLFLQKPSEYILPHRTVLTNNHLFRLSGAQSICSFKSVCFLAINQSFLVYSKRKTRFRCGITRNTHWWYQVVLHSPFGLVWDTLVSPACIPGCPTSSAGFPLVSYSETEMRTHDSFICSSFSTTVCTP